jgi:predicted RNA-binding Zn-ribbon protein involved in translation (DUF1610 family)
LTSGPSTVPSTLSRYAVVVCTACRAPWAVESRHTTASCPSCHAQVEVAARTRLWQGDDAREAQAAVGHHRAALAGGLAAVQRSTARRPEPRHDSATDAAAAQASGLANKSARAEAVALWMTRLVGQVTHCDLVEAMGKAGLDADRAEREVVRLLATDVMVEPKAGLYRVLDA